MDRGGAWPLYLLAHILALVTVQDCGEKNPGKRVPGFLPVQHRLSSIAGQKMQSSHAVLPPGLNFTLPLELEMPEGDKNKSFSHDIE